MPFLAADRVWETSTTNGTGNMLLLGAVSGYRTFNSVYNNAVASYFKFHYAIVNRTGTQWEVGVGSLNLANELVREQVLVSTSGIPATPETFTTGTKDIFVTLSAQTQTEAITVPGGRLTLETGVPASSSDQTAKSTLYYTPYSGNRIDLWDGSIWRPFLFAETSLSLLLTNNKNYDVFGYINTGTNTLNLELSTAWTTDTARATALTTQDGILVKSGASTRRYLGTLRANGTNVTEDSKARRFVWNHYNRTTRLLATTETMATSWTYTSTAWRQANATTTNRVNFVVGADDTFVALQVNVVLSNSASGNGGLAAVGYDTTTDYTEMPNGVSRIATLRSGSANHVVTGISTNFGYPAIGHHYCSWNEAGPGTGTTTWFTSPTVGMTGYIIC